MATPNDLKARLENSDAVNSLRGEQECVAAFKSLPDWTVKHGSFFRDPTTGKLREIDVLATRSYQRVYANGQNDPTAILHVLLEVKSMRGYHVVFAPEANGFNQSWVRGAWNGDQRDALKAVLFELGCEHDLSARLVSRFRELAYPDGTSVVHHLKPQGPDVAFVSTAFRETNIGAEKDLDNSVLWKAIQGLNSAIDGVVHLHADNFRSDVEFTFRASEENGDDLYASLERQLQSSMNFVHLYHPVIVLDAQLWVTRDGDLAEIDSARFEIEETQPGRGRWFDIVTRKGFSAWLAKMTAFYQNAIADPNEEWRRERSQEFGKLMEIIMNPGFHLDIVVRKRRSKSGPRIVNLRFPEIKRRRKSVRGHKEGRDEARKADHDCLKTEGVLCPWVFHRTGKKVKGKPIVRFTKAWRKACAKAGCPSRIPHDLRQTAVRNLVRAGIPERVAIQMTGHKTRSAFECYNIVSEGDLRDAAVKLSVTRTADRPSVDAAKTRAWRPRRGPCQCRGSEVR